MRDAGFNFSFGNRRNHRENPFSAAAFMVIKTLYRSMDDLRSADILRWLCRTFRFSSAGAMILERTMKKLTSTRSLNIKFWARCFVTSMVIALGLFGTQTANGAVLDTLHYNGHTYYLISQNSWQGAAAEALSLGGYLATINDQGEQNFLWNAWRNSLGAGEGLWIGLARSGQGQDIWVWMNGEPVNFTYWATNDRGPEPNNGFGLYEEDYVNMDSRFFPAGAWNDVPNDGADWLTDRGIVEVNNPGSTEVSTPEVSTLVLLGSGLAGLVLRRRRRARAAGNGDAAEAVPQESNSTPVA
jgi:hypothetical protein